MKQAKIDIHIFKIFLKIFIFSILGILVTTFIDDILVLPNFITALYTITIFSILISLVALIAIGIKISTDLNFDDKYRDEVYDVIFHKNDKKNKKDYDF